MFQLPLDKPHFLFDTFMYYEILPHRLGLNTSVHKLNQNLSLLTLTIHMY